MGGIRAQRRPLVIAGDVMVDRWVHGHVAECQDGCPKFVQHPGEVFEVPGGAANAERCLLHWGARVQLYGYAKNDCPIKTRYVEGGRIVYRADDDGPPARGRGYGWARDMAMEMVRHAGAVLMSDYDKGFLTPEFIREVVAECRKRSVPCIADCKRAPEVYEGAILKCNEEYAEKHHIAMVKTATSWVVTKGNMPPYVQHIKGLTFLPTSEVKCVNHVGAGDCFAAHLALAMAYGFSLKDGAALAHSAGRCYVRHPHNRPPTPTEVEADLSAA